MGSFDGNLVRLFVSLVLVGMVGIACEAQEPEQFNALEEGWLQKIDAETNHTVKRVFKLGYGIENRSSAGGGQGGAVRDGILYRLYHTGYCQTFDISDLAHPVKIGAFPLGVHKATNHSNCAQTIVNENGDLLLYVSALKGKCYVERVTTTGSTMMQTIVLPQMELFGNSVAMNMICGDDGYLWLFGSAGNRLVFAKAQRPSLDQAYVILRENDILDHWDEGGYNYDDDAWQGGMVYDNFLFMLFGKRSGRKHLAVYDVKTHLRIKDIDLSKDIWEEPEDCDMIPEGILVVTNMGSNYYLIRPE